MSDVEVMTTALVAMLYFGGNYTKARKLLGCRQYVPDVLSKSRFSRHLNRIGPLFLPLFAVLTEGWNGLNEE